MCISVNPHKCISSVIKSTNSTLRLHSIVLFTLVLIFNWAVLYFTLAFNSK